MSSQYIDLPLSNGSGVTSFNSLTGAITLAAGTNITLTPVGNTITIDASGGGGGGTVTNVTASTPLASTGGATPNISLSGIVALANGGDNHNNTLQTITSLLDQNALPPGNVKFTVASNVALNGIVAGTTGELTIVYNDSSAGQTVTIANESPGPSAANRIRTLTGASQVLNPKQAAIFSYDGGISRWHVLFAGSITGVTAPLVLNTAGNLSMPQATVSTDGFLNRTDWFTFNNKIGGFTNTANALTFWDGLAHIQGNTAKFSVNTTLNRLGIQTNAGNETAVLDVKSNTLETIADLSGFTASLIPFILPVAPTAAISQTTPEIQSPNNTTSSLADLGSGNYAPTDSIDYQIFAGFDDGVNPIVWGVTSFNFNVTGNGTDTFDTQLNIGAGSPQFLATNTYAISRVLNGGSPEYLLPVTGPSPSFIDNNTGWTGNPNDLSNKADDFVANGTNYTGQLLFYGTKQSPRPTTIVSASAFDPNFTDDNSGTAYKIRADFSGSTDSPFRIAWPGTRTYQTVFGATNIISGPIGLTSPGSPVIAPTAYGFTANGSTWNRTYSAASFNGIIFSPTPIVQTITDPSDSQNYYASLTVSGGGGSQSKVADAFNATGQVVAANTTFFDDGVTPFADGDVLTPTSNYAVAIKAEQHGSTLAENPGISINSLDGDYGRIDFVNSSGAKFGYIENNAGDLKLSATNGSLSMGGSGAVLSQGLAVQGNLSSTGTLTISSGGSVIQKINTVTPTLDFPSIAAGGGIQDLTVVTGCSLTDVVTLGLPATVDAGIIYQAWVSATNTITVRATNTKASGAVDPASAIFRLMITHF